MPIVGATNIGVIEAPSRSELVVQGTATGVCPVKVEWLNVSHGGASRTDSSGTVEKKLWANTRQAFISRGCW